uniref:DUF148 domain-containing protein n=1 Tax=Parastrongyloides trichosuri TaxID=131310 RepID=A0A0N5A737_PARTI
MKYLIISITISLIVSFTVISGDSGAFTFSKNCSSDPTNCEFTFTAPQELMETIDQVEFNKTLVNLSASFNNLTTSITNLDTVGNQYLNNLNNTLANITSMLTNVNSLIANNFTNIPTLTTQVQSLTNDASKLSAAMQCFLQGSKPSSECY